MSKNNDDKNILVIMVVRLMMVIRRGRGVYSDLASTSDPESHPFSMYGVVGK